MVDGALRHHDGEATGKKADRVEDWNVKHLARSRTTETLARVIKVGNDEDAEDRRLSRNQAPHADASAQLGRERHFGLRQCDRGSCHRRLPTRTSNQDLRDVSSPTAAVDSAPPGSLRSYIPVVAMPCSIPVSRRPRDRCQRLSL